MSGYQKYTPAQRKAWGKKMAAAKAAKAGKSRSAKSYRSSYAGKGDYKKSAPKSRPYQGGGAYVGAVLGSALGTALAPGIGTALGAPVGMAAGYLADKVFGWGDYTIHKNTLLFAEQPPLFEGSEFVRIRHREYLGDISSTTSFTNREYSINPGNAEAFPWLSPIADQFEQYRFNGLIFEFVSTSADALNSTNTALGAVILATDYDAEDPAYTNQQQMLSTMFSNSGKPACNIMHAVECDPQMTAQKWYYVRSSSVASGPDSRLYDLGNFQVATYGSQAAAVIGQLWVTYDVTFQKKQMNNVLGLSLKSDHFQLSGVSTSAYLGTAQTAVEGSNLGSSCSTSTLSFPEMLSAGTYVINYQVNGTSAACTALTFTPTNCTLLNVYRGSTLSSLSTNSVTTTAYLCMACVKITGQNATLAWSGATIPTSPSSADLFVMQINGNIAT